MNGYAVETVQQYQTDPATSKQKPGSAGISTECAEIQRMGIQGGAVGVPFSGHASIEKSGGKKSGGGTIRGKTGTLSRKTGGKNCSPGGTIRNTFREKLPGNVGTMFVKMGWPLMGNPEGREIQGKAVLRGGGVSGSLSA